MDSDLSAEIARIEAELAQDAEMRQQQQQQQQAPQLQQQPPASLFGFGQTVSVQPQQQQQLFQVLPQQQQSNPFNVNASPFMLTPPQPDYSHQQQQQQQQSMGCAGQAAAHPSTATPTAHSFSKDTDSRSIFIGNLPRGTDGTPATTPEELVQFFADCGSILNCTVLKDRATGELKGTAYIEFADHTAMGKAIDTKNNASFKGSTIIVCVSTSPRFLLHFSFANVLKPCRGLIRGGSTCEQSVSV
ncbi:putative RNA recognition motif (RRM, RBD, or RNP domain) [Leishmania utingensis]|uniref:RNA recognition motif (RRM, RBD, or RNP domain) n=1 Tax=Leishmania utingensis TaxID=653362 RepID=A0AAW3AGC9_9TRYP